MIPLSLCKEAIFETENILHSGVISLGDDVSFFGSSCLDVNIHVYIVPIGVLLAGGHYKCCYLCSV